MEDVPWWSHVEITSGANSKDLTRFYWINTLCKLSPLDLDWGYGRLRRAGEHQAWMLAGGCLEERAACGRAVSGIGVPKLPDLSWCPTFLFVLQTNDQRYLTYQRGWHEGFDYAWLLPTHLPIPPIGQKNVSCKGWSIFAVASKAAMHFSAFPLHWVPKSQAFLMWWDTANK